MVIKYWWARKDLNVNSLRPDNALSLLNEIIYCNLRIADIALRIYLKSLGFIFWASNLLLHRCMVQIINQSGMRE
jgi:hypothetical protein